MMLRLHAGSPSYVLGWCAHYHFETGDGSHGILVMDAENALNSINRIALLCNICILWPRASHFIFNTHMKWSPLTLKGHDVILHSCEGVVQGDPLSIFCTHLPLYQLKTAPLLLNYGMQMTAAVACFSFLFLLVFRYIPTPTKSHLIVED